MPYASTAPLLNRREAGTPLGVSLRTVDEFISTGDIPVVRLGSFLRTRPSALDYLIEVRDPRVNPRKPRAATGYRNGGVS